MTGGIKVAILIVFSVFIFLNFFFYFAMIFTGGGDFELFMRVKVGSSMN